jgi:hypothetical protein
MDFTRDPFYEVTIETSPQFLSPNGATRTLEPKSNDALNAFRDLILERLFRATVKDGVLQLSFENGVSIRVEPDAAYEAWQISSDDDLLAVCMPGGQLMVWPPKA